MALSLRLGNKLERIAQLVKHPKSADLTPLKNLSLCQSQLHTAINFETMMQLQNIE